MRKKIFLTSILTVIFIFTIHTMSRADVGSFDRYDSGGSSSSSSSYSGGSSSSSWSSSSSSWSSSSSSSSSRSSSSSSRSSGSGKSISPKEIIIIFGLVIVGAAYMIIRYMIKESIRRRKFEKMTQDMYLDKKRTIPSSVYTTNVHDVPQTHIHSEKIKLIDPSFSEEKIESYAKDLFVKLQNAWTAREWEEMRPLETESLFEQHNKQIQNYIDTNRINIVENIRVEYATVCGFRQEGDRDILEIALKATMNDYIIDATTKELLEGIKEQDRITVYKLTFERKSGVLTNEETEETNIINCPNCGAPTKITSAGKCPYCGSVITTGNNTWVLSGLEPYRN